MAHSQSVIHNNERFIEYTYFWLNIKLFKSKAVKFHGNFAKFHRNSTAYQENKGYSNSTP
ncbi:hypothetical protein DDU33_05325 [Actinobacillus porcitonsillarum]|uniref:Uncharacterized protein n=1 Tax=Actinobacillus porcitonsillarum TaxID=189834 RepID=A0A2U8FJ01_9PAST|nr:hypothetical protein DDU33_05325 [Actinobacillus porcitonsillarum]